MASEHLQVETLLRANFDVFFYIFYVKSSNVECVQKICIDASILTTNWAHEVIIQQHGQHKQYYKVQQE